MGRACATSRSPSASAQVTTAERRDAAAAQARRPEVSIRLGLPVRRRHRRLDGRLYGIETPLNARNTCARSLKAIFAHNFKPDLSDHACPQRPGYAHRARSRRCCSAPGREAASRRCRSSIQRRSLDRHRVSGRLAPDRRRLRGRRARHRASRARPLRRARAQPVQRIRVRQLLRPRHGQLRAAGSLSGFRYSATTKSFWFGPKIEANHFRTFFSTSTGFGTIGLNGTQLWIEMIEGELLIETLHLTQNGTSRTIAWPVRIGAGEKTTLDSPCPRPGPHDPPGRSRHSPHAWICTAHR